MESISKISQRVWEVALVIFSVAIGSIGSIVVFLNEAKMDWIEIIRSIGIAIILIVILIRFNRIERRHKRLFDQLVIQKWIYCYKFDKNLKINPPSHCDTKELQEILDRAIATFGEYRSTDEIKEMVKHEYWDKVFDDYISSNPVQDNKLNKFRNKAY